MKQSQENFVKRTAYLQTEPYSDPNESWFHQNPAKTVEFLADSKTGRTLKQAQIRGYV